MQPLAASVHTPRPIAIARRARRLRARGQALVILVLIVSIAAMLLVYGASPEMARSVNAEKRTRAVLEYARQALIGRAIGDANRPGSLPCPDGDDDGSADLFVGSACASYIGRLPWRTLGVGDLRDHAGERLWYALSPGFRDHRLAPALNSDSRGTLRIYSASDRQTTLLARDAVAVIFAPGLALPGQARDDLAAQCSTTGRHVARSRCPANYLDRLEKFNNAAAAGPYVTAPAGMHYNDGLAIVTTADIVPLTEQRVALEARNALIAYRTFSTCRCYPWAAREGDGVSDVGVNRGWLPAAHPAPENWPAGSLPSYLAVNHWSQTFRYAVARSALADSGGACATCIEANLSVDGATGHEVVLITPGYAVSDRPRRTWNDYIEDAQNRDADDRFITPLSSGIQRNRLYAIGAPAPSQSAGGDP